MRSIQQPPDMHKRRTDKKHRTDRYPESSRISPLVTENPVNQVSDWSQTAYFLPDLVAEYPLPQIVRCASRLVPGEDQALPINVHVPMLLCRGRSARKLLAKHVSSEPRSLRLTETDDTIVIPSDYEGYFLRLQARTTKDMSVSRSLQFIADNPVPAFVNFTPVKSYTPYPVNLDGGLGDGGGGSQVSGKSSKSGKKLVQHKVRLHPPGSVFVVSGTTKSVMKEKRKAREVALLQCSDEAGNDVLLPINQPGEFIQVDVPPNSSRLSVLPHSLITANRYPALVRYVYGDHAPRLTPCSFMFTLVDTFEEDSLIGCLLYPNHALMIEMPMTSSLTFQVALNREEVMSQPLPRHATEVVEKRRETFMKDLKLKCKFLHRVTPGQEPSDDMPSATVRTRQYATEAFFYL